MTKWVLWWLDNCFHGKFGLSVHLKFKFLCVRRLQIFILNSSWATDSHRTPHFLYYFVWGNLKLSTLKVVFFKSRIFWNLKRASKSNFYPCPECPVLAWIWIKVSVIKYHRPGPQQGLFSKPGWEKRCFLCKSTEEAEAQRLLKDARVCRQCCFLPGLSVVATETIKMLYFYLPDCWEMNQLRLRPVCGFLPEVLKIQCISQSALISQLKISRVCTKVSDSTVVSLLPAKTEIQCTLPCCCLCLCSGTVAAVGTEEDKDVPASFQNVNECS